MTRGHLNNLADKKEDCNCIIFHICLFTAFEEMLENPHSSAMYISDPETGPVLLQVSRIVQGFAR